MTRLELRQVAAKDDPGFPGERWLPAGAGLGEAHTQGSPGARREGDRLPDLASLRQQDRGRHSARPTRQRLALHAALEGPHAPDASRITRHEIHVGAMLERRVVPKRPATLPHVHGRHILDPHHEMRNPSEGEADAPLTGTESKWQAWPDVRDGRQVNLRPVRQQSGGKDSGVRLDANRAEQRDAFPHRSAREPSLFRYVIR
jgi:hypothetical protein